MSRPLLSSLALVLAFGGTAAAQTPAKATCPALGTATGAPVEFCGKQWASNTQRITCGEAVNDLCPLAGLPRLTELRARSTKSLLGLDRLTSLERLDLSGTKFSDYGALASLTHLKTLRLSSSYITNLSPIADLIELETLDLGTSDTGDWSKLAKLTKLKDLDIDYCLGTNLEPLANLKNLKRLSIRRAGSRGSDIEDYKPLAKLVELEYLDLSGTHVGDVTPISKLPKLKRLWLNWSYVRDISPLVGLKQLQELDIEYNRLDSVAVLSTMKRLARVVLPDKVSPPPGATFKTTDTLWTDADLANTR